MKKAFWQLNISISIECSVEWENCGKTVRKYGNYQSQTATADSQKVHGPFWAVDRGMAASSVSLVESTLHTGSLEIAFGSKGKQH